MPTARHLSESLLRADHSLHQNSLPFGFHGTTGSSFPPSSLPLAFILCQSLLLHLTCKCGSAPKDSHTFFSFSILPPRVTSILMASNAAYTPTTFKFYRSPRLLLWTLHLTSPSRGPSDTTIWMHLKLNYPKPLAPIDAPNTHLVAQTT